MGRFVVYSSVALAQLKGSRSKFAFWTVVGCSHLMGCVNMRQVGTQTYTFEPAGTFGAHPILGLVVITVAVLSDVTEKVWRAHGKVFITEGTFSPL